MPNGLQHGRAVPDHAISQELPVANRCRDSCNALIRGMLLREM